MEESEEGEEVKFPRAFTYSCLGIVDGSEKFSFNMLSRSHELGQEEIESLVQDAVSSKRNI